MASLSWYGEGYSIYIYLFGFTSVRKKLETISIVFEDLSRHSVFFRTEVNPKVFHIWGGGGEI